LKKFLIVTNVRFFLLPIFALLTSACIAERPTGYMATPDVDGYEVKTCNVDEFDGMWWDFDTDNTIANTFVPAYKDYCTLVTPDWTFFWNTEEEYGYYNYSYDWYCKNDTTMRIEDTVTGDIIDILIYGKIKDGCYSVKITYNSKSVQGDVCPCEYNGP
jgi:hypothetical protein